MEKKYLLLAGILLLTFSIFAQFSVLLVNDNANDPERYLEIDTTLSNIGVTYEIYNTVETATFPDLSVIAPFDVVIWYTGNDGVDLKLWDVSNPDDYQFNEPLMDYINSGGIIWLQGLDFFYDIVGAAPDEFTQGQFIYDYLGISNYAGQSYLDDGNEGVPLLEAAQGNSICSFSPVEWVYSTLWYADAFEITDNAEAIYNMGPQGYYFEGYPTGVYNEYNSSKIFTFAVETARIDTEEHTDQLFEEVLDYFESISGGDILVTDINLSGEGGATSINENGGSLQLLAEVLPENATNPNVFWSIISETTLAEIDQDGLLQATGTSIGNGIIWVKAAAVDGSGIADSIQVEISNQGADFEILLVNDNDFGTDRYLELDTTLANLGYAYDTYNTVTNNDYPDNNTLSFYDVIIWYTGNDGVNLKLWDVSDTNDYKFNAPLIEYLDNGGTVWLQGLDYFFDIKGQAPHFFEGGQFIHDYMGVKIYFAQSYVDDGEMGLPLMDVVPGNPICEFTPVMWTYATLWYADALSLSPSAQGIYTMGPDGYVFDEYYTGVYNVYNDSKILTFSVETARIDTEENTDALFFDVLEYFRLFNNEEETHNPAKNSNCKVYPNPVSAYLHFDFSMRKTNDLTLRIYDLNGKVIYSENKGLFPEGQNQIRLNIRELHIPSGIYSYELDLQDQQIHGKFIIQK